MNNLPSELISMIGAHLNETEQYIFSFTNKRIMSIMRQLRRKKRIKPEYFAHNIQLLQFAIKHGMSTRKSLIAKCMQTKKLISFAYIMDQQRLPYRSLGLFKIAVAANAFAAFKRLVVNYRRPLIFTVLSEIIKYNRLKFFKYYIRAGGLIDSDVFFELIRCNRYKMFIYLLSKDFPLNNHIFYQSVYDRRGKFPTYAITHYIENKQ